MVRLAYLGVIMTLLVVPASAQLDADSNIYGAAIMKSILSKVGLKGETVDRMFTTTQRQRLANVYDLTDANYETILRTGSDNPLSSVILPVSTIWVITVYGQDGISPMFVNASDSIATDASRYGQTLSKNMKFAR